MRSQAPSKNTVPPTPDADGGHSELGDLVRLLVNSAGAPAPPPTSPPRSEEVLVDTELDGSRYLLVRVPPAPRLDVTLSPREQEIVRMVAQGHPNKVIADVLNISAWTVGTHLRRIFAKLGVGSRAAMVARANDHTRVTSKTRLPE